MKVEFGNSGTWYTWVSNTTTTLFRQTDCSNVPLSQTARDKIQRQQSAKNEPKEHTQHGRHIWKFAKPQAAISFLLSPAKQSFLSCNKEAKVWWASSKIKAPIYRIDKWSKLDNPIDKQEVGPPWHNNSIHLSSPFCSTILSSQHCFQSYVLSGKVSPASSTLPPTDLL
jgi:hypothetical protein